MAVTYARRMAGLRTSEVRELLKLTAAHDIISFGGGLPPNECFPMREIGLALDEVLAAHGPRALQYSTTEGCLPLRTAIAARMRAKLGTEVATDEVLVTTGSQQALDLTGKVFLDEGDVVFCESPTYIAALSAFRAYRPVLVGIRSDEHGMVTHELARQLKRTPNAKVIYVVPDFQNPSGRTWSLERRLELLDLAARYGIPVIEDSPYRELRFEGEDVPTLFALDKTGLVIFFSTFSKIFSPGLRIGWVAARGETLQKYALAKQGADLHTSTLGQLLVATFIERFGLDAHIQDVCRTCRARRDTMLHALDASLPRDIAVTRPSGGLFLWVELPASFSAREWLRHALPHRVAFPPGPGFFPDGSGENTARLCFSDSPEPRIVEGVRRLALALAEVPGADRLDWPPGNRLAAASERGQTVTAL
jgi:2-aminoadipate transaminase